jgi:nicotinamide mononucleotide (NMN) deamidase PncC
MEPYQERLRVFVRRYQGPKLAILATGGAATLSMLATVPGVSRILDSIHVPYATEASDACCLFPVASLGAVSPEKVSEMLSGLEQQTLARSEPLVRVVVSAALTAQRYRRGENHAYVVLSVDGQARRNFHIRFSKFSEEEHAALTESEKTERRLLEDWELTDKVLCLIEHVVNEGTLEAFNPEGEMTLWPSQKS